MISGATRGAGRGHALARHLLKDGNEARLVAAGGLGAETLPEQLQELLAMSLGGRTDRPFYHVFCSPDPGVADEAGARSRFWALFEREFAMQGQPFCGVEHRKGDRIHEHRVYTLVRPSGAVVDLRWDYARREKCARITEFEAGIPAVPSRHARAINAALRRDGRANVADWLVASGTTTAARPVARLTPRERLIEERTGVDLDALRRATLSAWRRSADGASFADALRDTGLRLARGRSGPVVVDGSGTVHSATRLLGAASRRFEGERIRAATVKARLADLPLENLDRGSGNPVTPRPTRNPAPDAGRGADAAGRRVHGLRGSGGDAVRPHGGGGGGGGRGPGAALERLRARGGDGGVRLVGRLTRLNASTGAHRAASERARRAVESLDARSEGERRRAWALWGLTDIWGIPLA